MGEHPDLSSSTVRGLSTTLDASTLLALLAATVTLSASLVALIVLSTVAAPSSAWFVTLGVLLLFVALHARLIACVTHRIRHNVVRAGGVRHEVDVPHAASPASLITIAAVSLLVLGLTSMVIGVMWAWRVDGLTEIAVMRASRGSEYVVPVWFVLSVLSIGGVLLLSMLVATIASTVAAFRGHGRPAVAPRLRRALGRHHARARRMRSVRF